MVSGNKTVNEDRLERVGFLDIPDYIAKGIGRVALSHPEINHPEAFELRHHQVEAWQSIYEHRESGENKALLHMATGLGKTTVIAGDIIAFSQDYVGEYGEKPKILFLAHQIELLRQAERRYATLMPELSRAQLYYGRKINEEVLENDIVFATLQTMNSVREEVEPKAFDYIVVDESHHAMAPKYKETISYFEPKFRLGVTATPFRKDEKDLAQLFGKIVYSKNLAEAVSDTLLDAPEYEVIADEQLLSAIDGEFMDTKELRSAIFDVERNKGIARQIIERQAKLDDARTIIFTQNIAHAEDFTPYILGSETLHSDLNRQERDDILARFKDGSLKTIVAVDMLNEGVDIPEANLAVFLRSTTSRTIFEQQLGRVLRKLKGKKAHVLDFVATAERLSYIYELSEEVRRINDEKYDALGIEARDGELEYTRFGVFNPQFNQWSVDIIGKIKKLTEQKQHAPDGWMNVGELADHLQVGIERIYKMIELCDLPTSVFTTPFKYRARYLSPEHAQQLIGRYNNPEGYVSVADMQVVLGVSHGYVLDYIRTHDIETHLFVGQKKRMVQHISPKDAEKIIDAHIVIEAPSDWISTSELCNELGVDRLVMKRARDRVAINAQKFADKNTRMVSWHVSPEDAQSIREFLAPSHFISLLEIAEEFDVSSQVVKRRALHDHLDIQVKISDHGSIRTPRESVSIENAGILRAYFQERSVEIAPSHMISVSSLAEIYGISIHGVRAMVKKLGFEILNYRTEQSKKRRAYVTPEAAFALREFYAGRKAT